MGNLRDKRIGETNYNTQGLLMKIKEYRKYTDIDIEFEDGYISKNKHYSSFKNGKINNPNYKHAKAKNRIGEKRINKQNIEMEIIKDYGFLNLTIKFSNGYITKNRTYQEFKNGSIKNPYYPEVCNIGYVGEGKYIPKKDKKAYSYWHSMIVRCYDKRYQKNQKTYEDCAVCNEWHNFQNFAKWYYNNYYEINDERIQLDKDILFKGNKIYSPDTCCFVPQRINNLFTKNNKIRGKYLIGVNYNKRKRYKNFSSCLNENGKQKFLGYYETELEAFKVYKKYKEKYIKEVADEYKDKIPKVLYNAMYNWKVEVTD